MDKDQEAVESAQFPADTVSDDHFPVVGIGASAGGLEAFSRLLSNLSDRTGMAFVLIQHLDPTHESALVHLLQRSTPMNVGEVKDGMPLQADHVYVIPPDTNLSFEEGVFHLSPRSETRGHYLPIDHFLRSLAADRKGRCVGVVLSGTASDGTLGLKAIKESGGITFAQDETAKFDGMPRSAMSAGCVDFQLPPEEIAAHLVHLGVQFATKNSLRLPLENQGDESPALLLELFKMLKRETGVDFTHYKRSTISRRIKRRMVIHNLEELDAYVDYVRKNAAEIEALFQDVLIHVTSFFRDPACFEVLKSTVYPQILKSHSSQESIRIWVPGCSTGEEVYSIAISLIEFLGDKADQVPIKIFATDISEAIIEKARAGRYPAEVAADVSEDRLRQFFVKDEGRYQIIKQVRDLCVFARQNAVQDPPFSNLDLISCRNVLIYLDQQLQTRTLPIFHYALRNPGFLLLGNAETVGSLSDLFTTVDLKSSIFARKPVASRMRVDFTIRESSPRTQQLGATARNQNPMAWQMIDFQREADRVIVSKYGPPGVLIDENLEILQFRGQTGSFLAPAPGAPSLSLTKMAREGLQSELRSAVDEARRSGGLVRRSGVRVKTNGHFLDVNLVVIPINIPTANQHCYAVLFESVDSTPKHVPQPKAERSATIDPRQNADSDADVPLTKLREELDATKQNLQGIIEAFEASNEELKAANEEIVSSNEELQSTNEELQTAKEELQAANEELGTFNEELRHRNNEANQLNDDLVNLLNSVNIPILILGHDLSIRRFTPSAAKVLNLLPSDLGRPIGHLKLTLRMTDLDAVARKVIDTLVVNEQEVQDVEGRWYAFSARPYRTSDNKINGVVIALVDIDTVKRSEQALRESRDYAENIVDTIGESLIVLDTSLYVVSANRAFYETFRVTTEETLGRSLYELGDAQWNIPTMRSILEKVLSSGGQVTSDRIVAEFPSIGNRVMVISVRLINQPDAGKQLLLVAIADVTDLVAAERSKEEREKKLRAVLDTAAEGIITIDQQGIIQSFNRAAEHIFGYTASEAIGQNVKILMPAPYRESHDKYLADYHTTHLKRSSGSVANWSDAVRTARTFRFNSP